MKGQISLFDSLKIIWKRFPANIQGYCPMCGSRVYYRARGCKKRYDDWSFKKGKCECGANFINLEEMEG